MNMNIKQKLINEQFNINDLDFSDDAQQYDNAIFNKDVVNPQTVYDDLLNGAIGNPEIWYYQLEYLDNEVSVVHVNRKNDLKYLINFYSDFYPTGSLNWLDVSGITDMSELFCTNKKFKGNISEWDVSNVKIMKYMFNETEFNGDISKWDTGQVQNMNAMFAESKFNKDISKWDVSNVNDMSYMFFNSVFNRDISSWNVSNVRNMKAMFSMSKFNKDISDWDVSNVNDMSYMFQGSEFTQDISDWFVLNNLHYYDYMFKDCPIEEKNKPLILQE